MRTERELLELAAKAAGYQYSWSDRYSCAEIWRQGDKKKSFWQPHLDDGDSRRLQVALGMDVRFDDEAFPGQVHTVAVEPQSFKLCAASETLGDDPDAATRRAVLYCAALMGEAKPC